MTLGNHVSPELIDLIGEEAACDLAIRFGGTRLYLPAKIDADHEIALTIGLEAAQALAERFGPIMRVPLNREARVLRLRQQGASNTHIAITLCMTETGVDKAIQRLRAAGKISEKGEEECS